MPNIDSCQEELQSLLGAVARGDHEAFRELYERTAGRLLAVARPIVRRQEIAEEILQESFATIWERARDYDCALAKPMTWMITIVRNRALDIVRRPHVETPVGDDASFDSVADGAVSLEEWVAWRELYAPLAAELKYLAPMQRQAIALAYCRGLTQSEIAAHLGCPLGTVKTLIRRALAALAERMDAPQLEGGFVAVEEQRLAA